jgi:hypothetical protein
MSIPKPTGRVPVPDSQRRRRNKPASYGLAEPVVAGQADVQPELGFDAHPMVADMWAALGKSVEGRFFSAADWQRARWELWFADQTISSGRPSALAWGAIQHGLNELLVSPADKRRAGIALKQSAVDPDEVHAVEQIAEYRERLKSV